MRTVAAWKLCHAANFILLNESSTQRRRARTGRTFLCCSFSLSSRLEYLEPPLLLDRELSLHLRRRSLQEGVAEERRKALACRRSMGVLQGQQNYKIIIMILFQSINQHCYTVTVCVHGMLCRCTVSTKKKFAHCTLYMNHSGRAGGRAVQANNVSTRISCTVVCYTTRGCYLLQ